MPAVAWWRAHFHARHSHLGTGLPYPIKVAFLVLVLPVVFAYLLSVAGVVALAARTALKNLAARLRRRGDPTAPTH
jgi:hypothetical protein